MKVLMDADSLIKLTKAHLKERVCTAFDVVIPAKVRKEIMVNSTAHPECQIVKANLDSGAIAVVMGPRRSTKGDDALLAEFASGGYEAIATDDKRFIRKLRTLQTPYITPAVMLLVMAKNQKLTVAEAFSALGQLAAMISYEEVAIVKLKLESLQTRE